MLADSDKSWRVDSFQVPVPLGDCSLHFSIVRQKEGKPEIETAIIVDGGSGKDDANGKSAKEIINDTVSEVKTKYTKFKGFDYWLVTHWDDDHYDGALEYLVGNGKEVVVFGPVHWQDERHGMSVTGQNKMKKLLEKNEFNTIRIGQDFFQRGREMERPQNRNFMEWSLSLAENGTADLRKPMFLCVAAAGDCINDPDKDKPVGGGVKNSNNKNATSAFFIIAWPGSPNICYYAAGDGNLKIEEHFENTEYLKSTDSRNGALVLKGTHHGAFNAFHADPFHQMEPRNYVVSAGREYGHPTAALLVLFAIHKLDRSDGDGFTLYTSRYPYWLTADPEYDTRSLNPEHIHAVLERYKPVLEKYKLKDEMFTKIEDSIKALDHVDFEKLVGGLKSVWKFLANSDPPSNLKDKVKSYRVHMTFYHVVKGSSEVIIHVFGAEDKGDSRNKR